MMRPIDVRDLMESPGAARSVTVVEPVPDLHLELAGVPEDSPVKGELLLESVTHGILVSGSLRGSMRLSCARCLKEFDRDFEIDVREMFAASPDPEGDEYQIGPEGSLDPEQMVRDAVVLTMPFSPLCRADCLGLCERCGGDRNLGECTCPPRPTDHRWAALEGLFD